MLSSEECSLVYQRAYLPEHLPRYVEGISAAEPYFHCDHVCFAQGNHLIFIGYPLKIESCDTPRAYQLACERFRPATVAVIAPRLWSQVQNGEKESRDNYYRLDLPLGPIDAEVAYMVRRAACELQVIQGEFGREHHKMVDDFLSGHELTEEQKFIFKRIPRYLKSSETARLLEARRGKTLVAFTVVDLGSANYAFYLFNFRSVEENVPGASDLLFSEMVNLAQSEGKRAVNLGLGVHPGIRRFKEKWGGVPFLPYVSTLVHRKPMELGTLMNKL
ncbi:hypothetical protein ACFLWY_03110 [Chloroflexota bacterium]